MSSYIHVTCIKFSALNFIPYTPTRDHPSLPPCDPEASPPQELLNHGEQDRVAALHEVAHVVADALVRVVHGALGFEREVRVIAEVLVHK